MADEKQDETEVDDLPDDPATGLPSNWHLQFTERLNEKIKDAGRCPRCGFSTIRVGHDPVTPVTWRRSGIRFGEVSYPQAMLICTTCGHTTYYNLAVLGLVENP